METTIQLFMKLGQSAHARQQEAGSPASLAPQGCAAVLSFSRERVLDHAMSLKQTKKLNRQIIEKIRTERQRERGKE